MPSPYRAIFTEPGSRSFTAAGLVGRMPVAMMGLGIVTMVSQLTGAYGLAGALAAAMALSTVVLGPQVSRLVDQYGQRRVLRPATLVTVGAILGLTMSTRLGWPTWTLFAFAAVAGCVPGLGSMIRARWSALFHDSPRKLHAAFSWESIVDETCFVFGPILAIGLSTAWFPQAGPLAAACLLCVGVFWLTSLRATEPVPRPRLGRPGGSALRTPGLPPLVLTMVMLGVIFSTVDVVTVAFADALGSKSVSSLLLAAYALGSGLAGATFGLLHLTGEITRRWVCCVSVAAISLVPLQLVGSLPLLGAALFLAGLAVAPTMITTVGLVAQLVPREKLTEGMTWTSTGATLGIALGASVSGWAVDKVGADRAYLVAALAGVLAIALALWGSRRLRRLPVRQRRQEGTEHDQRQSPVEQDRRDERRLA